MNRTYTQKELFDYLKANPLNAVVWIGDMDNVNGNNYIFLDYLNENMIKFDDNGIYKSAIQISVYVKEFANRKILVDYIKHLSQFNIEYTGSNEGNYFVANMTTELFIV